MTIGVYAIVNINNGKAYIGSSTDIEYRHILHIQQLKRGQHNKKFQNAFNKYGEESFILKIIEKCGEQELATREQYWLDQYKGRNYNVNPFSDRPPSWQGNHHTAETKRKIGESQKGKKLTDAHRVLIREHWKIRRTIPVLQKTRDKLSKAHAGTNNPMFGKTIYDAWLLKYGKEDADRRWAAWLEKRKTVMAHLRGDNNPSRRPEIRQKISENRKGIKLSPEAIARMIFSKRGHKATEETKRKLSDSHWGELNAASKLSNKQREEIKIQLTKGESPTKLARFYSVSTVTIHNIRKFKDRTK